MRKTRVKPAAEGADWSPGTPTRLRRLWRFALIAAAVIIVLPILIVPLYSVVSPPASTLELWQRLRGVSVEKEWVPLEEIAPVLAHAVIMSEDGQFCSHRGIDLGELWHVLKTGSDRGASTIPMQIAKNLFLWQSRSYVRKALEFPLAVWIDLVLSKRRMMEIYLNSVEWGPGIFGAQAAAQHWFGVPASRLTRTQAARLAAALPNPHIRNPARPGPHTQRIAGIIEGRAARSGAYVKCLE